jgi:hypothetical protein
MINAEFFVPVIKNKAMKEHFSESLDQLIKGRAYACFEVLEFLIKLFQRIALYIKTVN